MTQRLLALVVLLAAPLSAAFAVQAADAIPYGPYSATLIGVDLGELLNATEYGRPYKRGDKMPWCANNG